MPILTQCPHAEPTIDVTVYNHHHQFMIDTGATYSCIGKDGAHLPLSASKIQTIGFTGKTQVIPMTEPVPLQIGKRTNYVSLLYSADTPVNLLGRDVLCQLQAKICSHDAAPTESSQIMHHNQEAQVFWINNNRLFPLS